MNEDELSEIIALLVGYRKLVREQIEKARHIRDYWENELERTSRMMEKSKATRSLMVQERKSR